MSRGPSRRGFLVAATAALGGCSVLPEQDDEPIEASATAPAVLRDGSEFSELVAATETVEVTVEVDFSGDVEATGRQDVVATVFRRVYEAGDRRFGLVTAPAVQVFDQPEVVRDPVTALPTADVVGLATGLSPSSVGTPSETETVTLLETETALSTATAAIDGAERSVAWARARAGADSVTAMAVGGSGPFDAVTRDA